MNSLEENHFSSNCEMPSWSYTMRGIGRAAYTLFNVPVQDCSLYEGLADEVLRNINQPLQSPINQQLEILESTIPSMIDTTNIPVITKKYALGNLGVIMQFSSHVPHLIPYGQTDYSKIKSLHTRQTEAAREKPLNFSDQLTIAVSESDNNLPEALWRLFISSRLYGRWFDSRLVVGLPELSHDDKRKDMESWAKSISACKIFGEQPHQDVGGDAYYTWSHALGRVIFLALADNKSLTIRSADKAMENGTQLMHNLAHRCKDQTLPSDHTRAAAYGNSIGVLCARILNSTTEDL